MNNDTNERLHPTWYQTTKSWVIANTKSAISTPSLSFKCHVIHEQAFQGQMGPLYLSFGVWQCTKLICKKTMHCSFDAYHPPWIIGHARRYFLRHFRRCPIRVASWDSQQPNWDQKTDQPIMAPLIDMFSNSRLCGKDGMVLLEGLCLWALRFES